MWPATKIFIVDKNKKMLISRGINLMKKKKLALPQSRYIYIYIGHEDHYIKVLEIWRLLVPREKLNQWNPKKKKILKTFEHLTLLEKMIYHHAWDYLWFPDRIITIKFEYTAKPWKKNSAHLIWYRASYKKQFHIFHAYFRCITIGSILLKICFA